MRLTFLGTAAAEGYPALWCQCERCRTARERGGRNLRFRSSLLINDDLLIDPGPDVLAAAIRLAQDLAPVQACLITHPHSDHLEPTTFAWRRKGFVGSPLPLMDVYGSQAALRRITHREEREIDPASLHLRLTAIGAFQHFILSTGGEVAADPRFENGAAPQTLPRQYEVWTFSASHAEPAMEPVFFALRQTAGPDAERRPALLYATDTGPFSEETWASLERLRDESGLRFDVAAIDSTLGLGRDGSSHMSLSQSAWHHAELERRGLFSERAVRLAHHFSHNGTPPYEELEAHLSPQGIASTYDGMVVTV